MSSNRTQYHRDISFTTIPIEKKESLLLRFFYHTKIGRIFLWILIRPSFSKIMGAFLNTKLSCILIKPFIQKNTIDMKRFQKKTYISFNDFFCRKLKKIKYPSKETEFLSPCDGKLTTYKIKNNLTFQIKHSTYSLKTLLQNEKLANRYQNGTCLIFRLTPDDYHRYHFIDHGKILKQTKINGVLHTVRPISLNQFAIYHENTREITKMKTKNFGIVTQIEIGALMVGKIQNRKKRYFKRGEEKGTFLFGGSTIIILIEDNKVEINPIFFKNTKQNLETKVYYQSLIGKKMKR